MPKRAVDRARSLMCGKEIEIHIDMAAERARATAWGYDLTPDYVRINSRYTTS